MSAIVIPAGQTITETVRLDELNESVRVEGQVTTQAEQPGVLTQNRLNRIDVADNGVITAAETAIQVEGMETVVNNDGTIDGGTNGVNIANGDTASAKIYNTGTITSGSRAINIGGVGGFVYNEGDITTTADPRNGTIYGDVTAQNVYIANGKNGTIDVGAGLNGDAISLELGANVNGSIVNQGTIQGRGVADGPPDSNTNQSAAVRLYWVSAAGAPVSNFNGNIVNTGTLGAENGAAVLIEKQTQLNGNIINTGTIDGGAIDGGQLAIDVNQAVGGVKIFNSGTINGDVRLSAGNDTFNSHYGEVNGSIAGADGDDAIAGGKSNDIINGGTGNDTVRGGGGDDILTGSEGDDIVRGGRGNDFVDGDFGVDTLTGGEGQDTFFFPQVGGTPTQAPNGIFIVNQPDVITDYEIGGDKLVFDSIEVGQAGGLKFQSGVSSELSGDSNLLVLQDGFANAAAAAKAIADNDNLTADAGAFLYFNTTLGIARFVTSQDLSDGGQINVLANLNNVTDVNSVSQFSESDFGVTTLT